MTSYKLTFSRIRDSLHQLAGPYQKVTTDPEKSNDSESEPDSTSTLKRESISSDDEATYKARWMNPNDRIERTTLWLLIITAVSFLISLAVNLFMRSRIDGACMSLMEPWSKILTVA